MSFLELLLLLLLLAVGLLQVSRRIGMPYPTMLAAAGVLVALVPGVPAVAIDPASALTIFIAPALVAAAYEFPLKEARQLRAPLFVFAIVAVLLTTGAVAASGVGMGMPLVAALALGAIVAPPDAAAATAVLSSVRLPRSTDTLIRGESLFNDAAALLLFEGVLVVRERGGLDGDTLLVLAAAVPLGVLIGVVAGVSACAVYKRMSGTLGETLLQFVLGMLVWVLASHLRASSALAVVTYALVVSYRSHSFATAQVRIHSSAVWNTAVFVLNVSAFLLMGMQARSIVGALPTDGRLPAFSLAGAVLVVVVLARLVVVIGFNRINALAHCRRGSPPPASLGQAVLVGWTGMRGLVTLAASLALPPDFPMRPIVVLAAFGVVLGTLILQGATLAPLVRRLDLPGEDGWAEEDEARRRLAQVGADHVGSIATPFDRELGAAYAVALGGPEQLAQFKADALSALAAERQTLRSMARGGDIGAEVGAKLEQELDLRELSLLWAKDRGIAEG